MDNIIKKINDEIVTLSQPQYLAALVDLTKDVAEPVPVLKIGDAVMFTRGNISTIGGKPKSKKTFLTVLLTAEYLKTSDTGKVMIIDTEMAKPSTSRTAKRVHRLMNWNTRQNNERLSVLSLREYDYIQRRQLLTEAINTEKPDLVFIDGVRDLTTDFNNIEDSAKVVQIIMELSSRLNCHICVILHENKMNGHLRGHLGAELVNKSETVSQITSDGSISTVQPVYTRNIEFEEFAFKINDEGLPQYSTPPPKIPKNDDLEEVLNMIYETEEHLSPLKLKEKVMLQANVRNSAALERIKKAKEREIIIADENGNYYLTKNPKL